MAFRAALNTRNPDSPNQMNDGRAPALVEVRRRRARRARPRQLPLMKQAYPTSHAAPRAAATTLELSSSSAADAAVAAWSLRSNSSILDCAATKSCAYAGGLAFVPREFGRAGGGEGRDEGAAEDAPAFVPRELGRAGGGSCDGAAETPLGEQPSTKPSSTSESTSSIDGDPPPPPPPPASISVCISSSRSRRRAISSSCSR